MKKTNFFEGWYFKEQCKELTIAFIPEVSYDEKGNLSGSLQIVLPDRSYYYTYKNPINMNLNRTMFIVMGKNVSTDACIHIDIAEKDLQIKGDIYFDREAGRKFNVMGPLSIFPLPCKHGILAMKQQLSGSLEIDGEVYDFDGGTGYLETDYGKSFPRRYMWSQCNWFGRTDCQIAVAAATIPMGPLNIMGTFACINYKGQRYKFATYKGAEVEKIGEEGFKITQGPYIFEGRRKGGTAVELKSPEMGKMASATREYLVCNVEYRLRKRGEELFHVKSRNGSYEFL